MSALAQRSPAPRRRRLPSLSAATLLIIAAAIGTTQKAWADAGSSRGGTLYSVEKRNILGHHEIALSIGTLPMDAFGKGLTLQGTYTYHFNQLFGWEVVSGIYSFTIGTGLEEELRERFQVEAESEPTIVALLDSNFVFKPLYGKIAVLNDTLITSELFFVAGPALSFFDDNSTPVGLDAGFGMRFFVGRYFSFRFDIRDYVLFAGSDDVRNLLYISAGVGLTFGFGDSEDALE